MVIFQIDIIDIAVVKAKGHAPVRPYRHGPESRAISFERVQPKCGLVHILCAGRLVQSGQDQAQTFKLIGSNFAAIILFKQAPQPLMPEALDHPHECKASIYVCQ